MGDTLAYPGMMSEELGIKRSWYEALTFGKRYEKTLSFLILGIIYIR